MPDVSMVNKMASGQGRNFCAQVENLMSLVHGVLCCFGRVLNRVLNTGVPKGFCVFMTDRVSVTTCRGLLFLW